MYEFFIFPKFTLKGRKVFTRSTFKEAIDLLPINRFVRVHRSFTVAVSKIEKVERHLVTIEDKKIPVTYAFRTDFNNAISRLS